MGHVLAFTCLVVYFQNCGQSLPEDLDAELASVAALTAAPNPASVYMGQSSQIYVDGGSPPYSFVVLSGPGVVGTGGGLATSGVGTILVQVTDSKGRSVSTGVNVTNDPAIMNFSISTSGQNYNLRSIANSNGYNGTQTTLNVTISSGVLIGSSSTSLPALDTGTFPSGVAIRIVNNGTIAGAGGAGGMGAYGHSATNAQAGGAGGVAFYARVPISMTNNGVIQGGGGGGGGGGNTSANANAAFSNGAGSGGGGAGSVAGAGRAGTAGTGGGGSANNVSANGSLNAGGAGGTVQGTAYAQPANTTGGESSDGGRGGDPGQAGARGANGWTSQHGFAGFGAPGGAAGNAVVGESLVTYLTVGTIKGPRN